MTGGLKFVPFTSVPDAAFWQELSDRKLNIYRLDDTAKPIWGYFQSGKKSNSPCRFMVDSLAFDLDVDFERFVVKGVLYNANQLEYFKNYDKPKLLDQIGQEIWDDIKTERAMKDPSLLNRFLLLSFSDVKKYKYYYWFNFPALVLPQSQNAEKEPVGTPIDDHFSKQEQNTLVSSLKALKKEQKSFFVINRKEAKAYELNTWENHVSDKKLIMGFSDPSSNSNHPGWPLRNLLILLSYHCSSAVKHLEIVCYREEWKSGEFSISHSIVIKDLILHDIGDRDTMPKVVGWERNAKDKLGPRVVNLSSSHDPKKLAESACSLNLRLMRWRLLPTLDLDKIANTKCLLLGSGTLGCNVSRCLIGWGVNQITFVDNGKVSFSNPVRQTLYEFQDCLEGGKSKALAAAEALKRIYPSVKSTGYELNIPMPGHFVDVERELEECKKNVELLDKLISEHDVVYLLMDSRESRWLPTVMCQSKNKLCMNSALGFDSFMIMRHGTRTKPLNERLGCYYCTDVVAPDDSSKDRTLDQQCTVSRPGLSFLASSMVSELMVSTLQHIDGNKAEADVIGTPLPSTDKSPLGLVPHQVRGFLSSYQFIVAHGKAYDKCTGCSDKVIDAYEKDNFDFLLRVFNSPNYLEDLTGLTEMKKRAEEIDFEIDSDSDEDF